VSGCRAVIFAGPLRFPAAATRAPAAASDLVAAASAAAVAVLPSFYVLFECAPF